MPQSQLGQLAGFSQVPCQRAMVTTPQKLIENRPKNRPKNQPNKHLRVWFL